MIKTITDKSILKKILFMLIDIITILISSTLALLVKFDFNPSHTDLVWFYHIYTFMPVNIIITISVFAVFKLYDSLWAFAGITEMVDVAFASIISFLLQYIIMSLIWQSVPRSYHLMYVCLLFIMTAGSRFSYRFVRSVLVPTNKKGINKNVMIIGAGDAANYLIKEIRDCSHLHGSVKCIIDDAADKQNRWINGIKVVGTRNDIALNVERYSIDKIIIAMPSVSPKTISEIVNICKDTNCELKILPGIYQFVNGEENVSKLRKVDVKDLLGREPVKIDLSSIMSYVKNKVVLVTGGGGSIGSELCRQIAAYGPKQLIIVDCYENNAYQIQQELLQQYPNLNLVVLIGSVRNAPRIDKIFETYRPHIIYHAAAHKHVPLMEDSPNEAIKNNVLGTWNTVKAADAYGAERFVMISTDKAVNPTNMMGATKRICEMIVQTYNNRSKTDFVAVRFGNVLDSNGSVIPLFKSQIEAGGPVTVTHPDIIRYFMTIQEAVSLVLQAGAYAKGGEIFVLKMGKPVKILDLATDLIRLSGYTPNEDIMIKFTGLRPGEKLYEELLMAEEGIRETQNELIYIGNPIEFDEETLLLQLEKLQTIICDEPTEIRELIQEIVPTYVVQENRASEVVYKMSVDVNNSFTRSGK